MNKYNECDLKLFKDIDEVFFSISRHKSEYINIHFKVNANGEYDLSERQYQILFIIGYFKIQNVTEIANMLGQSVSSTSLLMTKLYKNEFLEKIYAQEGQDNRKVSFILTERGKERFNEVTSFILNSITYFIGKLDIEQKKLFIECCTRIYDILPFTQAVDFLENSNINFKDKDNLRTDVEYSAYILMTLLNVAIVTNHTMCKQFSSKNKVENELTKKQFNILFMIYRGHASTVTELSNRLFVSESSLSTSVTKLAKDKLLIKSRGENMNDSRIIKLSLTDLGNKTVENKFAKFRDAITIVKNKLSQEEKESILFAINGFKKLINQSK